MSSFKTVVVEITSASMDVLLKQCNDLGIDLLNIRYLDELKVQVSLSWLDLDRMNALVKKRGDRIHVIARKGLYVSCRNYLKRPVLLVGVIIWLVVVLYLPTRVLFLRVEGNQIIESAKVIEAAEKCGIRFGASRRYVRSEKVKNALLSEIEALQWAGVNTFGCVAVISVKERSDPIIEQTCNRIKSIVAERDGIITEMTVTRGTPLCKVGQAVRGGQILVSGFTDCGQYIKTDDSEAEIRAITHRYISAIIQTDYVSRVKLNEIKTRYSIQIGKNVVKLYYDSGIRDAGCVKIYKKHYLTLPGGFILPICWIEEISYFYNSTATSDTNDDDFSWAHIMADDYILNDMIAGRILRSSSRGEHVNGVYCINGNYLCEETIGQLQIDEMGDYNGKGNR